MAIAKGLYRLGHPAVDQIVETADFGPRRTVDFARSYAVSAAVVTTEWIQDVGIIVVARTTVALMMHRYAMIVVILISRRFVFHYRSLPQVVAIVAFCSEKLPDHRLLPLRRLSTAFCLQAGLAR
jgi:hypothetical protein